MRTRGHNGSFRCPAAGTSRRWTAFVLKWGPARCLSVKTRIRSRGTARKGTCPARSERSRRCSWWCSSTPCRSSRRPAAPGELWMVSSLPIPAVNHMGHFRTKSELVSLRGPVLRHELTFSPCVRPKKRARSPRVLQVSAGCPAPTDPHQSVAKACASLA
jgi:hypothetical protein